MSIKFQHYDIEVLRKSQFLIGKVERFGLASCKRKEN